ncbi:MAG: oligosaccharide flippase family protein [Ignavibacteriae bacterium]|nr:oligosaccharide flippase family protein [Ignavibacteriota bacterium]
MKKFFDKNIRSKTSYLKNFFWRALQMISRQGIGLAILLIAAKLLPTKEFGIYNYLVAFAFLFTLLADFGISRAVTKFTAEYNLKDNEKVKIIFFNSGVILFSLIFLFTIILFLFKEFLIGEFHYYLIHLIPVFIFLPLTSLYDGIYNGLKQFKTISKIYLAAGIIALISSYFLIVKFQTLGAFYALDLYYFLLFIFLAFNFKQYGFKFDKVLFNSIAKYSVILGVSSLGHFMYAKATVIILGKFNYFTEAGYYELIDKIFMLITFGVIIFGQVIAPRVTELSVENKNEIVLSYFKKIVSIVFTAGIICSILLYFIFPFIMEIFLDKYLTDDFLKMFNILLIHLPLILISGSIAQPFVIATGFAKYSLLTIPFGVLNIIFSIIMVEQLGFIGAVYTVLVISICSKLTLYYLIYKKLGTKN